MQQCFDLIQEPNANKNSASKIIRCLHISLKSSAYVLVRTIIEIVVSEHLKSIGTTIELLIDQFRREKSA